MRLTDTRELVHRHPGSWKMQRSPSGCEHVAASCQALYFKSPVPYMPGEELTCVVEYPIENEAELTICIEFSLKVIRMDTDVDPTAFGIACLIEDERGCTLNRPARAIS